MAKVIQFHGAAPSGWSRERWAWIKSITKDPRLSPLAKLLAHVMTEQFAARDVPECSPGLEKLCEAVAMKRTAVVDAIAELVNAGWLERGGGNAPGKRAVYRFKSGEQVQDGGPEHVRTYGSEQCRPGGSEQCRQNDTSMPPSRHCEEIPPAPPYKELPNMNQKPAPRFATKIVVPGGYRPTHFHRVVPFGSAAAAEWDAWLIGQGFRPLDRIGKRVRTGQLEGWDMPWMFPPSPDDAVATGIGQRFARWLSEIA